MLVLDGRQKNMHSTWMMEMRAYQSGQGNVLTMNGCIACSAKDITGERARTWTDIKENSRNAAMSRPYMSLGRNGFECWL